MYHYGSEEETYLWHDTNRRNDWINGLANFDANVPQQFYFRFFQFAHVIYRWCEGKKLNPRKCKTQISPDGAYMHIPNDVTATNKLVWARLEGYPWWPARVCKANKEEKICDNEQKVLFFEGEM